MRARRRAAEARRGEQQLFEPVELAAPSRIDVGDEYLAQKPPLGPRVDDQGMAAIALLYGFDGGDVGKRHHQRARQAADGGVEVEAKAECIEVEDEDAASSLAGFEYRRRGDPAQ